MHHKLVLISSILSRGYTQEMSLISFFLLGMSHNNFGLGNIQVFYIQMFFWAVQHLVYLVLTFLNRKQHHVG
jgi:hypothetical protein